MTFDPTIYRRYNVDLEVLKDEELAGHHARNLNERRLYCRTDDTVQAVSQRWIRGTGIEVGAGGNPTPLYGNARTIMGDVDNTGAFGGDHVDLQGSVDARDWPCSNHGRFDFSIASHVLEHVDSLLRGLGNLLAVTRPGGIVYIVLPDIGRLHDQHWMPNYPWEHHVAEFEEPLAFADAHDAEYIAAAGGGIDFQNDIAVLSDEYKAVVKDGKIPAEFRFFSHKHNYNFGDWLDLMVKAREFFANRFRIVDVRYGHERADCHFVLELT